MAEMKKEYLVIAQQKRQQEEGHWTIVRAYLDSVGKRFYSSLEEAKAGLNKYIGMFNKDYVYDSNGKRKETDVCGGIGVDFIASKELDDENRVVAWKIKVREVTPWEMVEEG